VSNVYAALAQVDDRTNNTAEAKAMRARRLDLWSQWEHKLPGNPFVRRQFAAASR
jgi:hypothetical protein